jgi:putative tricarboxylic transport membrane protein
MRVRNGKDFWAGLMYAGFGLAFMLTALGYRMGSAVRMGPGYFPVVLGGLLALLGAVIFIRSFVSALEHPLRVFRFRPLLFLAALAAGCAIYFARNWLAGEPRAAYAFAALALALFFGAFGPRSMFLVLLAVVIFGYALQPLGLVLATILLIAVSAVAGHDIRSSEMVILTVVLVLFGALVFVKGLGLPFNLWPGA